MSSHFFSAVLSRSFLNRQVPQCSYVLVTAMFLCILLVQFTYNFFIRPTKLHEPEQYSSIKELEVETSEKFLSNVILRIPTLFVGRRRI